MDREIRSFVLRGSRLSDQRKKLVEENKEGLIVAEPSGGLLDFSQIYGNKNPVAVEIGFGMGDSPLSFGKQFPQKNLLAIEVHLPGIARLYSLLLQEQVNNVRIAHKDAAVVLKEWIPNESIDSFQLFFPDPWQKKKHHKRRLIQMPFLELLTSKLVSGGALYIATDWEDYAFQMRELLLNTPPLSVQGEEQSFFVNRPDFRPLTRFEKKGIAKNHQIFDLMAIKK